MAICYSIENSPTIFKQFHWYNSTSYIKTWHSYPTAHQFQFQLQTRQSRYVTKNNSHKCFPSAGSWTQLSFEVLHHRFLAINPVFQVFDTWFISISHWILHPAPALNHSQSFLCTTHVGTYAPQTHDKEYSEKVIESLQITDFIGPFHN